MTICIKHILPLTALQTHQSQTQLLLQTGTVIANVQTAMQMFYILFFIFW